MLESKNLTKKFASKTAVNSLSIHMERGHIYAMMGPNGSGKTTFMKMAAGLIKPTDGQVFYCGKPVDIKSRGEIAYMSTEPYFYSWMNVEAAGRYYADFFKDFSLDTYHQLLKQMNIDPKQKITALSTGMTAKMKIAVTLARDAKLCMLDEPFNGIDLLARDDIRKTVLEYATSERLLLISSHLVEEMENIADRSVFIKNGQLVEVDDLKLMKEQTGKTIIDRYREIYAQEGNE